MTTPPHDGVHEDVGLYALGALDSPARADFESHLSACDECRSALDALRPVVAGLAMSVPQVEPPAALRERVLALAREPRGHVGAIPAPASATPRAAAWAWLAAAAALVVTVGIGGYAMRLQQRVDRLTARLAEAERSLSATRSEVVEARRALGTAESSMRILFAPDLARVDLAGQATYEQARGRAFYSPSTGLLFTAANLPALPANRVYQLWLVTATAPVSAGLLAADAAGSAAVTLAPPPADGAPVAFAVTIEPEGGVPAPTGDKVLVGLVGP